MKFDTSQAESQFALLCSQINSFGISVIGQYEQAILTLQEENKKLKDEVATLKPKEKKEKNQGEEK